MSQKWLIVATAVIALAAGIGARLLEPSPEASVPQAGLSFSYPDLDGKQRSVEEWRGKLLVVNFWATWCGPCKQEMPGFAAMQQEYAGRGVQFIGVAVDDLASVQAFLREVPVNYPILIAGDAGSLLANQLGNIIGVLPFTVLVDSQGAIVQRKFGELSKSELAELLAPLVAEK